MGIPGASPGVSSSLLDSDSEKSWSWSWSGVCISAGVFSLAGSGAVFSAGVAGFSFDPRGAAAGALVKCLLMSLEVEIVASLGEHVSPGLSMNLDGY